MYLKVLVMEIKDDYCLAMTEDGAVVRIQKKDGMKVGKRIYILREDLFNKEDYVPMTSGKERKIIPWKFMTAAAAVLAAVIGLAFLGRISPEPYAVVSVDGQRSIQLALDKHHTVKKAVSYNHSISQKKLEKLEGKDLEEAGEMLKQTKSFSDTEQQIVSYGFYEENHKETEELKKMLQEELGNKETVYLQGTASDVEQAEKEKKTLGVFLLEKAAKEEELEEVLEELPPEKAAELLKGYPELAGYAEIFEEDIEEEKEELEEKEKEREEKENEEKENEAKEQEEEKEEESREKAKEQKEDASEKDEIEKEDVVSKIPLVSAPSEPENTKPQAKPEPQPEPQEIPEEENESEEENAGETEQEEYEEEEQEESEETEE